jgi:hypothetical protein
VRNPDADYPSAEQIVQLDAALDALAEGRSYRPTLNGLIRGWRELVEQIEAGYDSSIYEYFNDLHIRTMLQAVNRRRAGAENVDRARGRASR